MQQRAGGDARADRPDPNAGEVRAAVRFAGTTAGVGVALITLAALWVRGCGVDTADTVTCGAAYRTVLAAAAPTVFLGAGLWAFWRTYQIWRARGSWWGWQGVGWFLFTVMVFTMMVAVPPIAGLVH